MRNRYDYFKGMGLAQKSQSMPLLFFSPLPFDFSGSSLELRVRVQPCRPFWQRSTTMLPSSGQNRNYTRPLSKSHYIPHILLHLILKLCVGFSQKSVKMEETEHFQDSVQLEATMLKITGQNRNDFKGDAEDRSSCQSGEVSYQGKYCPGDV